MESRLQTLILEAAEATAVARTEEIQPLWNGYGTLARVHLEGGVAPSVIVKHIQIPREAAHPRGFSGDIGRQRKVRSYEVEVHWYRNQNGDTPEGARTPRCLGVAEERGEVILILEDLAVAGYPAVLWDVSLSEIEAVLRWLARFHACFVGDPGEGLWPTGTYWHLETRPEELANIQGTRLHRFAGLLDACLRTDRFLTLVHGDAKLANYCFSDQGVGVAAVDFQYVGRGSAMKDVAYFLGSCLSGEACERLEDSLLESYFQEMASHLPEAVDPVEVEAEWRRLFPLAWADFERFMLGWSPGHKKLTEHSDSTTQRALSQITEELLGAAREACVTAGKMIVARAHEAHEIRSKGLESRASDVVTAVDLEAQRMIVDALRSASKRYELGLLAEEGAHDDSRLHKHAFWSVDPLDGTAFYIDGEPGYATSVALVDRSGEPILGVVYDPARDELYEAVAGEGVKLNGQPFRAGPVVRTGEGRTRWYADRSLLRAADHDALSEAFDLRFVGGAVRNGLAVLADPAGVYLKRPRGGAGGCAIWDLAAVSLMVREAGGTVETYRGGELALNPADSVHLSEKGFVLAGAEVDVDALRSVLESLEPPSAG